MGAAELTERWKVPLPAGAEPPYDVYVNGVPQIAGRDYELAGRTLLFDRHIEQEGRLGFWRWLSIFLGLVGTYRKNDSVDVHYTRAGKRVVATGLEIQPPEEPSGG